MKETYLTSIISRAKRFFKTYFTKNDKVKYKLSECDHKVIALMKERYDADPIFKEDGTYTFNLDMKDLENYKIKSNKW